MKGEKGRMLRKGENAKEIQQKRNETQYRMETPIGEKETASYPLSR